MQAEYAPFIKRLIDKYEGGYSWHPKDPGGPTNFGISCYDYAEYRHKVMESMAAWAPLVKAMTRAEAEQIYKTKYAAAIRFDELQPGVDCTMLDYAVNSGPERAIRVACQLVGMPSTNVVSDTLLKKIYAYGAEKFISAMCAERLRFMHAIDGGKMWAVFGNGWNVRVTDLRSYALHVANGAGAAAAPAPDLSKVITPKATHVGNTATGKTSAGVVVGGVVAHSAGLPPWGVGLVVVAILVLGLGYEIWHDHKATAANLKVHI